jgi:hypothetical protein
MACIAAIGFAAKANAMMNRPRGAAVPVFHHRSVDIIA